MSGIMVDVDVVNQSVWTKDNDSTMVKTVVQQIGMQTSAWEHKILEMLFSSEEYPGEAVSAVKALGIAASEGQRIYQITKDNVNAVLPVLNIGSDVKNEIRDSVAVGKVATVSQNNITVGSWTGVGYIIADADTGAYRISGGSNGAAYHVGLVSGIAVGGLLIALLADFPPLDKKIGIGKLLAKGIIMNMIVTALMTIIAGALPFIITLAFLSDNPGKIVGCFISGLILGIDFAFIWGAFFLPKIWQQIIAAAMATIDTVGLLFVPQSNSLECNAI